MQKLLATFLIYIASWCYVIAAYYHLRIANWTFVKAMAIAMPLVFIEYCFSLNGNKLANATMNPLQILIVTICFYVINIWILNTLVLKNSINPLGETIALGLIITALFVSTNTYL